MTGSSHRSCFLDLDRKSAAFIGLSNGVIDFESSESPKSPLDLKIRSPRSPIWNRDKVGLSLISKDECTSSRIVFSSSGRRNAFFFPISGPKSFVDRPLAERFTSSSKSLPSDLQFNLSKKIEGLRHPAIRSVTEIERSEDYTRIISRGANPKTTHIFGDCVLEDPSDFAVSERKSIWIVDCCEDQFHFPVDDFLRICFCCKKKLDGEDIYIFRYHKIEKIASIPSLEKLLTNKTRTANFLSRRGDKAFCSRACRSREIGTEEDAEDSVGDPGDCSPTPLSLSWRDVHPGDEIAPE